MSERNGEELAQRIDLAAKVLTEADSVALACHVNPDPDAIGSMLGLASFLASRGTAVVCSWPNDPLVIPAWLERVGGGVDTLLVPPRTFPREPELFVALDTASRDRLAMLAGTVGRAGASIVLDHHATNPGFGSISVVDPAASSTAELTVRVIDRMGGELPDAAAACLYAGILTDTGRFQYESSTSQTLEVAARLRAHRFDHVGLGQALFEDNSLGYLRALALAAGRVEFVPEASMVWTYLTQEDVATVGIEMLEMDDLIDIVRTAREADVACVIKQQRSGGFKVSLRSRGASDVGAIAAARGGGGHRLAAGYSSKLGPADAAAEVATALAAASNPSD